MKNMDIIKGKPGVAKGFSTLTFNLRFGLADDGANSWDHRKKGLSALFKKYHLISKNWRPSNPVISSHLRTEPGPSQSSLDYGYPYRSTAICNPLTIKLPRPLGR